MKPPDPFVSEHASPRRWVPDDARIEWQPSDYTSIPSQSEPTEYHTRVLDPSGFPIE